MPDGSNLPPGFSLDQAPETIAPAPTPAQAPQPGDYGPIYDDAAHTYGVDPNLLRAVTHVESGGNPRAVSPAGAQGLQQIMPGTQRSLGVSDPFDAWQSIFGSAALLRENFNRFHDPELAVAAYHGGTDTNAWGPITRQYVRDVAARYDAIAPPIVDAHGNILDRSAAPVQLGQHGGFQLGQPYQAPKKQDAGALPSGFVLDKPPAAELPSGFVMDQPANPSASGKLWRGIPLAKEDVGGNDPLAGLDPVARHLVQESAYGAGPQQSQLGADVAAAARGAMVGTGAMISGAGEAARAGMRAAEPYMLGLFDKIDQGGTLPGDMNPVTQSAAEEYRTGSPEVRQQMRSMYTTAATEAQQPGMVEHVGREVAGAAPRVAPWREGMQTNVAGALGGLVPLAAFGAAAGPVGAGIAIAGQSFDSAYHEAKDKGLNDDAASSYAFKDAGVQGALMAAPVARVVQSIPAPLREGFAKSLINIGQHGLEFGSFNALSNFAHNFVTRETIDPKQPLMQGVGDAAMEGVVAGMVFPTGVAALHGVARAAGHVAEAAQPAASPEFRAALNDTEMRAREHQAAAPAQEAPPAQALGPGPAASGGPLELPRSPEAEHAAQPVTASRPVAPPPGMPGMTAAAELDRLGQPAEAAAPPPPVPPEPPTLQPTPVPRETQQEQPPAPAGFVRFYHGGAEYDRGPRWLTPDLKYAEGYAEKSGGMVSYVDVPQNSPLLVKAFDDTGSDVKAPFAAFEASDGLAKGLRPLDAPAAEQTHQEPDQGISPTLRSNLWQKLQSGDLTEAGGRPSLMLAAAAQEMAAGAIKGPEDFDRFADSFIEHNYQPKEPPPSGPTSANAGEGGTPVPHETEQEQPPPPAPVPPSATGIAMVDPLALTLDPQRFQYKEADDRGVTGALQGVQRWEPALANPITAWQGDDGQLYVVNGHQRTNLALRAKEAGQEGVEVPTRIFSAADGYTPEYMRALGAYQNIAEGTGTAVDAARVLRASASLPEERRLPELPPRSQLVRDAAGLAKLSDQAFGAVENGAVPAAYAARVGDLISDPSEQWAALDMLARAQPANAEQARFMVQDIRNSGFLKGAQTTLFGDEEFAHSLVPERARILDNALKSVRRARSVFRAAVEGEETLSGAGNRLTREGNVAARTQNERLLDFIQREAANRGDLSDALTAAARDLAAGTQASTATSRFLTAARDIERRGEGEGVRHGRLSRRAGPAREGEAEAGRLAGEGRSPEQIRVELGRTMQAVMHYAGLPRSTGLRLVHKIVDAAGGAADASYTRGLITFAMDTPPADVPAKLFHEVVHGLMDPKLGVLTEEQRAALNAAATRYLRDPEKRGPIEYLYGADPRVMREEAVARIAEDALERARQAPGLLRRAADAMVRTVQGVGQALRGEGFLTADDVFRDVMHGRLAGRDEAEPAGEEEQFARRPPLPPQSGAPLLGEPERERGAPKGPEPTVRNDERQTVMPGMESSAVQAQAARDQTGRGALIPQAQQKAADEGLFAPKPPDQTPLFSKRESAPDEEDHLPGLPLEPIPPPDVPQVSEMPPDSLWGAGHEPPSKPPRPPEVEAAHISAPRLTKNLNPVEQLAIFPRTLASLDDMSAHFWNAWQARERLASTNVDALRQVIAPNFLKLSKEARGRVAAALEIGRIQGEPDIDADGNVTARNTSIPHARWSKVGDTIKLTPQESLGYREAVELGRQQWEMLMRGIAKRYGWDGPLNPALIRVSAGGEGERVSKGLQRLADLLGAMKAQQQEVYVPLQRFGSYFISVRPKSGEDVVAGLGGRPPLAWFEMIEKPPMQELLGTAGGRFSVVGAAEKRMAELRQQFPPDRFDIEHGDFSRTPSLIRRIDLPAIDKLMMLMETAVQRRIREQVMSEEGGPATKAGIKAEARSRYESLYGQTIQAFEDALYEELKAGYRKKAQVVPGYSADYDRAIGTHLYQIGRNAADAVHRDGVESAYTMLQDYHPHRAVADYWRRWREYQEEPGGVLTRAANGTTQVGFAYVMGMSPSSTLIMATHTPLAAGPVLSVGIGPKTAMGALGRGLGSAYRSIAFDAQHGAHIDIDKAVGGMPKEKQAFIRKMAAEGRLAAVGAQDLGRLNERQSALWGEHAGIVHRALEIATSNVSAVDQANRIAVASAAWDIASDRKLLNAAAKPLMEHSALFRDMVERDGLSSETFGRFMLSEAAFEWGKQARAPIMRGPLGTLAFTLHGFQTRYLSTAFNLLRHRGGEGRLASLFMMGALTMGAGALGLPFAQDVENIADWTWRNSTGFGLSINRRMREALTDAGLGKIGAEIVMHGPLSVLTGADLGARIGFGDVASRWLDGANVLGSLPAIAWNAWSGAKARYEAGQPAAAVASEAAPMAFRGPLRAIAAADQGVVSRTGGTRYVGPQEMSAGDLTRTAIGFTPLSVSEAREKREEFYQARRDLPAIRQEIKNGQFTAAVHDMVKLGMSPFQIKETIRETVRGRSDKWFQRYEQRFQPRPAQQP